VQSGDIFVEKGSGMRNDRPQLAKALAALEAGDTLACYKLDRIGRSLAHVTGLLEDLQKRCVHFATIEDGLNTKGSAGKLILQIMGAIAEFERSLIMERVRAGIDAAKRRGKHMGRPCKWSPEMVKRAKHLMTRDGLSADEAAKVLGISRRTLFRGLQVAREYDAVAAAR
jgi:DNA invertase Pin-like site-specific DNA recombinase